MLRLLKVLFAYWRAKRLVFSTRRELEQYQASKLHAFLRWVAQHSPYFHDMRIPARYQAEPSAMLASWPLMDKEVMMKNFDRMNTAGLPLDAILEVAREAEATRDFQATMNGFTVGLSSGTSAVRGAFLVSEAEKAQWAGTMLAKMLPAGLFAGEKVALFLRADSGLYQTVKSPWISFRFFDLLADFGGQTVALEQYRPTIVVAPAQVLRQLALKALDGSLHIAPKKVISVAEVLEPQDAALISQAFGTVHQVYQATEGFIASTCEEGTLHLNEEYLHIEPEWLDAEQRRFVPIITDFTRRTQPIIRYRLNDVLVAKKQPCQCGRVTRAIEAIEGRCDDMLLLPGGTGGQVPVFADSVHRLLAQVLPLEADYRLTQLGPTKLGLDADVNPEQLIGIRRHLDDMLRKMGVRVEGLEWALSAEMPAFDPYVKRRRIRRQMEAA